jgi:tetratricopeptide (TPR) repeat protein
MNKYRKITIAIVVVAAVGVGIYFALQKPESMKDIPELTACSGNTNASAEFLNAQRAVEYYRDEIRKKPEVVKNYVELAQLFLQEARVTGRHHEYIPKARRMLDEALSRDPENFEATITKASMLLTLHQFQEAKQLAEKAIARNSYNAFAQGVLCDANVELGNYDDAVKACDKMLGVRPDLRSYSRASYLRELHGDYQGASEAMKMAADAGVSGQENRAWALYNLGKLYLGEGKLDTAAYIFNGILEERPNYAYALSGLAQVKCARKEYAEAIILLVKASQITPEHVFVEQLADIYRAMGQTQSAETMAQKAVEAFTQHEQDGWNVDREYAMFCANHDMNLLEALKRAKNEYDRRPNNIDVLETYAWLLYKNGKASEALPFIEQAMRLNTRNSVLYYHAGMIYDAVGQRDQAVTYLERSLNENPFVNVLYVENAQRTLAALRGVAAAK